MMYYTSYSPKPVAHNMNTSYGIVMKRKLNYNTNLAANTAI